MDKAKKRELFGSDSEDDDDDDEVAAPAPEDAPVVDDEEEDLGDDNLFGSEDEEEGGKEAPAPENSGAAVHYSLPSMPRPSADAKLYMVKLPNILQFQPRPFDPETYEDEDAAEDEDGKARAENVVRWRETASGERQSNARLVTWSDGSMTLHVGDEVLTAQQVPIPGGTTHLYTRHARAGLECHGILKQKMSLAPASLHSKTHQELSEKIARVHRKETRMQVVGAPMKDPAAQQAEREKMYDEKKKQSERQAKRRERNDEMAANFSLTADYLDMDDDDGDLEGNLGAIRKQFKERRQQPGKRLPGTGVRKQRPLKRRRAGDDSDDDEGEDLDDDDEDEEEDDGDPAEMDGFIVGDEEDEDGEYEDRPSKKKGKKGCSTCSSFQPDP
eukprot:CAMPEP_0174710072 /NCGR_PEP_ID=MMETSP1094-20130205/11813_1 /TAXON_ID=156173 /ORGANISM="Chrysochromulina brevifilum, Strain UTEX LB 985" /LENGTH=386 /DNA_ID=CAMNT_0015908813 /DNA_START=138 /DNA_END=1298 /DNA_ORIENTATION=-